MQESLQLAPQAAEFHDPIDIRPVVFVCAVNGGWQWDRLYDRMVGPEYPCSNITVRGEKIVLPQTV
jgi:hypothetical protein